MLNVMNLTTGKVMLMCNVETYFEVYHFLDYYRGTYSSGVPYPNGQGVYTGKFVICRQCDCCDAYHIIQ